MMTQRIADWIEASAPQRLQPLWHRFRASPLWMRLARGLLWTVIGAVISRGLGVVSSIIVARMLGMTAFGEFGIIQSTVGLFGTFAGLGLGITATKYVAELRESDPDRCGRMIGLVLTAAITGGVLAGIGLWVFAPWLAVRTLAAPQLAPLLQSASALVLFTTLQGIYSGALGGLEAFKRVAQVNWMGGVFGTPLLVIGALVGGLPGAVWGSVFQMAVGCVIGHVALSKEMAKAGITLSCTRGLRESSVLWHFSLPALFSSLLVGPVNWICNMVLVHQPEGYREAALLTAAGQWRNLLSFLPLMMSSVLVPMFSNLYQAGQAAEFRKLLRRNLLINVGVCLALAVPLSLLGPLILGSYGPGFGRGLAVFVVTLSGTVITAACNLLSRAMQAAGQAWLEFMFSFLWAAVMLAGCLLLVPHYKAMGVAISHVLASVAVAIWQWRVVRRLFSRSPSLA